MIKPHPAQKEKEKGNDIYQYPGGGGGGMLKTRGGAMHGIIRYMCGCGCMHEPHQ
jgi:hypothetical protein